MSSSLRTANANSRVGTKRPVRFCLTRVRPSQAWCTTKMGRPGGILQRVTPNRTGSYR